MQTGRHKVLVEVDLLPVLEGDRRLLEGEQGRVRVSARQPEDVRRRVDQVTSLNDRNVTRGRDTRPGRGRQTHGEKGDEHVTGKGTYRRRIYALRS